MTAPADALAPIDFGRPLLDQCEAIYRATQERKRRQERMRLADAEIMLFDGEMRLQHVVRNEYGYDLVVPSNETGTFDLPVPFDSPVGQWGWEEKERLDRGEKKNINFVLNWNGSRVGGLIEHIDLDLDEKTGGQILTFHFLTDMERLKWYSCWSNPWFPEWIQWPQVFLAAGPIPWLLALMLDLQVQRERASGWAVPSDPMDPNQRTGLDQSTYSLVVKPISFLEAMASGALWGLAISRFKNFFELAQPMMDDGEIGAKIGIYLEGDPEPWPGANLRPGTRYVWFEDFSGTYTGTAHGGTIWDGLIMTVRQFVGDMIDSTESLVTDTTIPPEYYDPNAPPRTQKILPFVVWRDGEISGLERYKYRRTHSKGIQVVTGGHSMPGVNEGISAFIQMVGDLIAAAVVIPPIGGTVDALLAPIYTDALLAFMVARSASRAAAQGWTRYFELFQGSGGKAYTLSALLVLRAGFWATRAYDTVEFAARDASPFVIGEAGHVWVDDRCGFTIRGDKTGRIYMDRVSKFQLRADRQTPPTPSITIGSATALEDPVAKAFKQIREAFGELQQLGLF
ncbi:Gp37-like protein [Nocardia sp. NPDC004750]